MADVGGPVGRRRWSVRVALATVAAVAGTVIVTTGVAYAAFDLDAVPNFPVTMEVGETATATLTLTNNSTSPQNTQSITLSSITLTPSCGTAGTTSNLCSSPDPGVYSLSPTGSGSGACAGITFTIGAPNAAGTGVFTPSSPVVLAAGASCTISFTATVLKTPTVDADPTSPGIQTWHNGRVQGTATDGTVVTGVNSQRTNVFQSQDTDGVVADFDGDGDTDPSVFRPSNGTWYLRTTAPQTVTWGVSTDVPVAGDYDGDGQTDVAVWRPSTGEWFIRRSSGGSTVVVWGVSTDVPVPADYDGDGRTDIAVWRPSTGEWFIRRSSGGVTVVVWGVSTDVPVPGDYDGDGRTDIAVWRPSTGVWYVRLSSGGNIVTTWGVSTDVPVPGDYDGDGRTDIAVWRPSTGQWFVSRSSGGSIVTTWGVSTDVPVAVPPAIRQRL